MLVERPLVRGRHVPVRRRPRHHAHHGGGEQYRPCRCLVDRVAPSEVAVGDADLDEVDEERVEETGGVPPRRRLPPSGVSAKTQNRAVRSAKVPFIFRVQFTKEKETMRFFLFFFSLFLLLGSSQKRW